MGSCRHMPARGPRRTMPTDVVEDASNTSEVKLFLGDARDIPGPGGRIAAIMSPVSETWHFPERNRAALHEDIHYCGKVVHSRNFPLADGFESLSPIRQGRRVQEIPGHQAGYG